MRALVDRVGRRSLLQQGALAVLLLAFALRLFRLGYQSIWWDEAYSIDVASRSLIELTSTTAADIHPPLYYYLLHFWMDLSGQSEFVTRFLSLIWGLLLVALLYRVGGRLLGRGVGLLAAALAALSPFWVAYSQELRAYSLETFLSLASAYLAYLLLRRAQGSGEPEPRLGPGLLWPGYVLVTVLSLYTDYFPVFVIAFENVVVLGWLMLALLRGRSPLAFFGRWALAQVLTLGLYLPWFGVGFQQVTGYGEGSITAPPLLGQITQVWYSFVMGRIGPPAEDGALIAVVALVFWGGLLLALWRRAWSERAPFGHLYLLTYLLGSVAAFLVVLVWRPYFHPRYIMVGSPPFFALLGLALVGWWRQRRELGLIASLGVILVMGGALQGYFFDPNHARDDVREVIGFLEEEARPDDLIMWITPHPFTYYYQGQAEAVVLEPNFERTPDELARLAQGKQRAFWVIWTVSMLDPWEMVPFLLGTGGPKLGERYFSGYRVVWHALSPSPTFSLGQFVTKGVNFEDKVALTGVALQAGRRQAAVPSGDQAWVSLRWQALSRPEEDLKFYVLLRDAEGHRVGHFDRLLFSRGGSTSRFWRGDESTYSFAWPQVLPGVPPGDYQVEVGVYEAETARRLAVMGGSTPTLVGSLRVERPASPPTAKQLHLPFPVEQQFGEVKLLGHELNSEAEASPPLVAIAQGDVVPLTFLWQADGNLESELALAIYLAAEDGEVVGQQTDVLGGERYPASRWIPGDVVRQWIDYRLPPDVLPGQYRLELRLAGAEPVALAQVAVSPRERQFSVPEMAHEIGADFEEGIRLLGFDLASPQGDPSIEAEGHLATLRPGNAIDLTLYWQASSPVAEDYTVFTHLLGSENRIWGQKDSAPQEGAAPTTSWLPGQVIADRYRIPVAEDAPRGDYELEVGLYRAVSGQRLSLAQGGDRVVLGRVRLSR